MNKKSGKIFTKQKASEWRKIECLERWENGTFFMLFFLHISYIKCFSFPFYEKVCVCIYLL